MEVISGFLISMLFSLFANAPNVKCDGKLNMNNFYRPFGNVHVPKTSDQTYCFNLKGLKVGTDKELKLETCLGENGTAGTCYTAIKPQYNVSNEFLFFSGCLLDMDAQFLDHSSFQKRDELKNLCNGNNSEKCEHQFNDFGIYVGTLCCAESSYGMFNTFPWHVFFGDTGEFIDEMMSTEQYILKRTYLQLPDAPSITSALLTVFSAFFTVAVFLSLTVIQYYRFVE